MSLSRLSDQNVTEPVIRSYLYRDLLTYVNDLTKTGALQHDIALDEAYRPDLVSFRVYQTTELRWLVGLVTDIEDEAKPLPVGRSFRFPPIPFIRERIRHYAEGGGA